MRKAYAGKMFDLKGLEIYEHTKYSTTFKTTIFNTFFNPLEYNGSMLREAKDAYKTNELGFFIGLCFVGVFGWSIISYRRNSLVV